jgi:hypothetical protein
VEPSPAAAPNPSTHASLTSATSALGARSAAGGLPVIVWLIAGAMGAVLLIIATAYGFHRDELYFILVGRHPDFG